jgi:hypothetical protein
VRGRGLDADRVVGCTIYDWRLEFTKLRGFWMDNQRGKYDRDIFIEQEDVKLAATAFLRHITNEFWPAPLF